MRTRLHLPLLLAALALAGCDNDPTGVVIDRGGGTGSGTVPGQPRDLDANYQWILEGWTPQGTPAGHAAVVVTWKLPTSWNNEPFRVYARRTSQSTYTRIATVTSCEGGACRYVDINVVAGNRYEYYVAAVNESTGQETVSDFRDALTVPTYSPPPVPQPDSAVGLDNALYLRWKDAGAGASLWKYMVFLVGIDASSALYQLGEADATGFLDLRARNGHVYRYRVAAVDTLGHVSAMSAAMSGIPRPDFRGELLYAHGDSAAASGFQFVRSDSLTPVVSGASPSAQWRLEVSNGTWQIRPLGETEVVSAGRTSGLACGPASDPGCTAVTRAPTTGYTRSPVAAFPEVSYVFRVRGSDGRIHYGVVRPQLLGSDQAGKGLMILDWAYQLLPDEPRLHRGG